MFRFPVRFGRTDERARSLRRALLVGGLSTPLVALSSAAKAAGEPSEPLIDKWLRTKKARIGAQLSQIPTGFLDQQTGTPTGFDPTLFSTMIHTLSPDIEIEWINLPVSELVLAWMAGKFDMLGQSLAATPSRALKAWFTSIPCTYACGTVIVRKDTTLHTPSDLNHDQVRIAVMAGGAEAMNTGRLFPKATINEFQSSINAGGEVAVGRADATVLSAHNVATILTQNPNLKIMPGKPIYLDASGWMLPQGDTKTLEWVNNYLRYASVGGDIAAEWKRWYVPVLKPFGVTAATVGPMGVPLYIDTATA